MILFIMLTNHLVFKYASFRSFTLNSNVSEESGIKRFLIFLMSCQSSKDEIIFLFSILLMTSRFEPMCSISRRSKDRKTLFPIASYKSQNLTQNASSLSSVSKSRFFSLSPVKGKKFSTLW